MSKSLPKNPSLEQFRKLAKDLHKSLKAGDGDAVARLREFHPAYSAAIDEQVNLSELSLRDAQLVVSREHHFENWADLKEYMAWDVPVKAKDLAGIREAVREKPARIHQDVRTFRPNGSFWSMAPIHFCNNNSEMMELLLELGAELNVPGESMLDNDSTPEFVDFAAKKGADLNAKYYNWPALTIFVGYGPNIPSIKRMLAHGADVNIVADGPGVAKWPPAAGGNTPLHIATCCSYSVRRGGKFKRDLDIEKYKEVVRILLAAGADVHATTFVDGTSDEGLIYQGETPLHFAAACGDEEMIQLLLDHGADKQKKTAKNETPLDYAKRYERPESIVRLLE